MITQQPVEEVLLIKIGKIQANQVECGGAFQFGIFLDIFGCLVCGGACLRECIIPIAPPLHVDNVSLTLRTLVKSLIRRIPYDVWR